MKIKKFSLIIVLIWGILFNLNSQTSNSDSLVNLLSNHTNEDTLRVNILNKTANEWNSADNAKALKYAEEAERLADKIGFTRGQARSLILIGENHYYNSDYPEAEKYYRLSLELYDDLENESCIAKCLNNIGLTQLQISNYDDALVYYRRSLKIYEKIKDWEGISNALNNIGVVNQHQGNYPVALDHYHKSLKIYEKYGHKLGIAHCLNNIGIIYRKLENFDKALENYYNAMKTYEDLGDKLGISSCQTNIGIIHNTQGNYAQALECYENSLKIKEEIGDQQGISTLLNNIGNIHFYKKEYTQALENYKSYRKMSEQLGNKRAVCFAIINIGVVYLETKNYKKAEEFSLIGLELAKELKLLHNQKEIYAQLAEIYEGSKNYKKAYENHILFKELNDSIYNESNLKKILELENEYLLEKERIVIELEQQKKENIRIEKEKQDKFIRLALITGVIIMLIFILILLRIFAQKNKAHHILSIQKDEIEDKNLKLSKLNLEIKLNTEELEKSNSELIVLNATKDKFFSIIGHDLKSPFSSLLGLSNQLVKNPSELDPLKRDQYISLINKSAKKIYNLLDNLLSWASSQTGLVDFYPTKLNANKLMSNTLSLMEELVIDKQIKLINNSDQKLFILADKNMVETIVRNLISNAIKFSPKGSEISVNTNNIIDNNNIDWVEISIADNGVGISEEKINRLFDITENISTLGTDNEAGTGLGLILCKEFVEKNGGNIWVESEAGIGSKFIFTLKKA